MSLQTMPGAGIQPVTLVNRVLTKGILMHVLIAALYACTIYLSTLMYVIVVDGPLLTFLMMSPVLISVAIGLILALDFAVGGVTWAWRKWRLARTN